MRATLLLVLALFAGCYSFRGISIDPSVNTFYVAPFENRSTAVVPTLPQDFTNKLIDKVRNESRLVFSENNPDVEFTGVITGFNVTSEAPQPGETVGFNRLTITASVEYINNQDDTKNLKFSVSWYDEFGSDQNLLDVQDELIRRITDQLVEDIFTKAFTNW